MNKKMKRILSGASTAALMTSAAAQVVAEEVNFEVAAEQVQATEYSKVAGVKGQFSFDQNVVTPADEVFSLFGSVVTGLCAKPDFAIGEGSTLINVGGDFIESYTVDIKEKAAQVRTLLCSCATSVATANAKITGVLLKDVLELAKIDESVNTIAVKGADGYTAKLPLKYALDKEAMFVYQVGGKDVPSGNQFWVPETVAKYFTRSAVEVQLTAEAEVPAVEAREEAYRAEVAIMNTVEGREFAIGETITFEGYSDDCGDAIAAIEFSMDGGETWTTYQTANATADKWVYWNFSYAPEAAGTYQLTVRAKTESGNVSPLAANVVFNVI